MVELRESVGLAHCRIASPFAVVATAEMLFILQRGWNRERALNSPFQIEDHNFVSSPYHHLKLDALPRIGLHSPWRLDGVEVRHKGSLPFET